MILLYGIWGIIKVFGLLIIGSVGMGLASAADAGSGGKMKYRERLDKWIGENFPE